MILAFSQERKGVTATFREESSGRCDQMVVRPNAKAAKTLTPQCDLSPIWNLCGRDMSVAKVNESFWNGLLLQKGISWCLSTDRRFHRSLHPCALSVANQLCFATKGAQRGTKVFRVGAPPQTAQTHCRRQPKTSQCPPCAPFAAKTEIVNANPATESSLGSLPQH